MIKNIMDNNNFIKALNYLESIRPSSGLSNYYKAIFLSKSGQTKIAFEEFTKLSNSTHRELAVVSKLNLILLQNSKS